MRYKSQRSLRAFLQLLVLEFFRLADFWFPRADWFAFWNQTYISQRFGINNCSIDNNLFLSITFSQALSLYAGAKVTICLSQGLSMSCGIAIFYLCTSFHSLHAASITVLIFVSASEADKSLLSCSLPLAGDCLAPSLCCLHPPCPFMVHQLRVKLK